MRAAEQCMDTNSTNEESKISRTAWLKMVTKSGVNICILTEYFSFKKSKPHNYIRFPDVFQWPGLLIRMAVIETGGFIHETFGVQTTTTFTCHSYWNTSWLSEALGTSHLIVHSDLTEWPFFPFSHVLFGEKKWISAVPVEVQRPPLFP